MYIKENDSETNIQNSLFISNYQKIFLRDMDMYKLIIIIIYFTKMIWVLRI